MTSLFDEPTPKRRTREPKPKGPERHRWIKLRIHVYICLKCGMGKTNHEDAGYWQTTYAFPDGRNRIERRVPECQRGPMTEERLQKTQRLIEENKVIIDAGNWKAPF